MLPKQTQPFFSIPSVLSEELANEIETLYRHEAERQIPIVQTLISHLTYYFLRFAMYEISGEDVTIKSEQTLDIQALKAAYSNEIFSELYKLFKLNVVRYLEQRQLVYEENWLYEPNPIHYVEEVKNSPLQEVW